MRRFCLGLFFVLLGISEVYAGSWTAVQWKSSVVTPPRKKCFRYLYTLGASRFLSPKDKQTIKKAFDEGEIARGRYERTYFNRSFDNRGKLGNRKSRATRVINPIHTEVTVQKTAKGFSLELATWGRKLDADAQEMLKRTAKKIAIQLQDRGFAPAHFFDEPRKVRFFGVRYFVAPGKLHSGLFFHRDGGFFQGLVILQRSKDLKGGEFMLRPYLKEPTREFRALQRKEVTRLRVPKNRLFIFQNKIAEHAVGDFDLRHMDADGSILTRDILGFHIF